MTARVILRERARTSDYAWAVEEVGGSIPPCPRFVFSFSWSCSFSHLLALLSFSLLSSIPRIPPCPRFVFWVWFLCLCLWWWGVVVWCVVWVWFAFGLGVMVFDVGVEVWICGCLGGSVLGPVWLWVRVCVFGCLRFWARFPLVLFWWGVLRE